jgi:hypothetical protein
MTLTLTRSQAAWIVPVLLVAVVIFFFLLLTVVHAETDGPADRLCKVIRALNGLPVEANPAASPRKEASAISRPTALQAGRKRQRRKRRRGAPRASHDRQVSGEN